MTYTIWIQDPLLWLPFGLFVFILFLFLFQLALFLRVERYSQMFLLVTQGWGQESLSITANLISLLDEKHLHFHCIFIKLIREDVAIYSLNKKSFFYLFKMFYFLRHIKNSKCTHLRVCATEPPSSLKHFKHVFLEPVHTNVATLYQ